MSGTIAELRALQSAIDQSEWETRWDGTLGRSTVVGRRRGHPADLNIGIHRRGYGNVPPEGEWLVAVKRAMPALLEIAEKARALSDAVNTANVWNDGSLKRLFATDEVMRIALSALSATGSGRACPKCGGAVFRHNTATGESICECGQIVCDAAARRAKTCTNGNCCDDSRCGCGCHDG